ncbi:MAG: nucleotide disphospho-sugar-binding domain-containing protein [Bacteriovoracaceae bacterium]
MKAIVYNIFGLGHINSTLPLVTSLVTSGVEVLYHSSPERKALIESTGAKFVNYGYDSYQAADFNPGKNFVQCTLPATLGLLPFLMAEIEREKPDFIIYDSMAPWGYVLSHIFNIPAFCSVSTFALSKDNKNEIFVLNKVEPDEESLWAIAEIKMRYGVELNFDQTLGTYNEHNLLFTAEKFHPAISKEQNGQKQNFYFVGSQTNGRGANLEIPWEKLKANGRKILYMSLGTLTEENTYAEKLFHSFLETFGEDKRFSLILSTGKEKILSSIPSNAWVQKFVPQVEVLIQTDIFITHGGMNSLNEALSHGVPVLVIPHAKDQWKNAAQVTELSLGEVVSPDKVTPSLLREKVLRLQSPFYKKNCLDMKKSFQETLGTMKTTEMIRQLVGL